MYNVSSWSIESTGNSNFTRWATWNNKKCHKIRLVKKF